MGRKHRRNDGKLPPSPGNHYAKGAEKLKVAKDVKKDNQGGNENRTEKATVTTKAEKEEAKVQEDAAMANYPTMPEAQRVAERPVGEPAVDTVMEGVTDNLRCT